MTVSDENRSTAADEATDGVPGWRCWALVAEEKKAAQVLKLEAGDAG